ncbi:polysaccharide deacetylase family protein [Streptacidiphilus jiangxiensis]|uniref:Peptidoglycan/xylan/chitin deacetylase, PgdA/CDA1 family n=1 Tax=Streptacidiphilus jiangxiensis TaxID=235985 RepID=A0A1H7JJ42_STRJI|nr:polysaccharide deacetylase family protein [Streptacidiphilus jiangxiensis]SEK74386.1 Peptidoglycan/xylan/chitin deacetylase, PgdA/CDA1 family [Streptacidiphilus jiangxiensis]
MSERAMGEPECWAGIAWTADGYEAVVVDRAGRPVAVPTRWGAARVAELAAWLHRIGAGRGRELAVVLDSTNGLLDGPLTAAGLDVRRADPWTLPQRPAFGSVSAAALADCARRAPASPARLTPESGSLAGREAEFETGVADGAELRAALTAAGRCVEHGRRDRRQVALTFDDGPDPVLTRQILAVLARHGARATFFCVGHHVAALPEEVRRITEAGHELGNHSWSHPFLPDLTPAQLCEQIDRTAEAIARVTGREPSRFRPPYGSQTPEVLATLAGQRTTVTLWDVDSRDWARPGAERIATTVLEAVRPGSVVLLHEGAGDRRQTVLALPAVLAGLADRGLEPVTLTELLAPDPPLTAPAPALTPVAMPVPVPGPVSR